MEIQRTPEQEGTLPAIRLLHFAGKGTCSPEPQSRGPSASKDLTLGSGNFTARLFLTARGQRAFSRARCSLRSAWGGGDAIPTTLSGHLCLRLEFAV